MDPIYQPSPAARHSHPLCADARARPRHRRRAPAEATRCTRATCCWCATPAPATTCGAWPRHFVPRCDAIDAAASGGCGRQPVGVQQLAGMVLALGVVAGPIRCRPSSCAGSARPLVSRPVLGCGRRPAERCRPASVLQPQQLAAFADLVARRRRAARRRRRRAARGWCAPSSSPPSPPAPGRVRPVAGLGHEGDQLARHRRGELARRRRRLRRRARCRRPRARRARPSGANTRDLLAVRVHAQRQAPRAERHVVAAVALRACLRTASSPSPICKLQRAVVQACQRHRVLVVAALEVESAGARRRAGASRRAATTGRHPAARSRPAARAPPRRPPPLRAAAAAGSNSTARSRSISAVSRSACANDA